MRRLWVLALALCGRYPLGVGRAWALALCLVLLLDPFARLSLGFWISFLAEGLMVWIGSGRLGALSWAICAPGQGGTPIQGHPAGFGWPLSLGRRNPNVQGQIEPFGFFVLADATDHVGAQDMACGQQ